MIKNASYVREEQRHRKKRSINEEIGSVFEHIAGLPIYTLLYNPPDNWSSKTRSPDQELLKQHLKDEQLVIEEKKKLDEQALRSKKHFEQTAIFRYIFSRNVKNTIFDILDIEIFKEKIAHILQRNKNVTIVTTNPIDLIQISTIHVTKNNTEIFIKILIETVSKCVHEHSRTRRIFSRRH